MPKRVILNDRIAGEIYAEKLTIIADATCPNETRARMRGYSVKIAGRYGVNPKTIRDVWNGRTWKCGTDELRRHSSKIQEHSCCVPELAKLNPSENTTDATALPPSRRMLLRERPKMRADSAPAPSPSSCYRCANSMLPLPAPDVDPQPPPLDPPPSFMCPWPVDADSELARALAVDPFHLDWPHW